MTARLTRGAGYVGLLGIDGNKNVPKPIRFIGAMATGAPLAGTWKVGDVAFDLTTGGLNFCTVAGTPGTWITMGTASGSVSLTGITDSGTLAVTGASTLTGAVTASSTLAVTGAVTAASTIASTGGWSGPHIESVTAVSVLALDVTLGPVYTKTIAGDSTFTASAAGTAGQKITLIITASGAQRVATMGTNLNAVGTITIPSGKVATISLCSDGTAFRETGRAINA